MPMSGRTVLELGYERRLEDLPQALRSGVRDRLNERLKIRDTRVPNYHEKIKPEVDKLHMRACFTPDEDGQEPVELDR